jgi:hypothetical protein
MPAQITVLNPTGINRDIDSYELPEKQWSDGNNVEFDNDKTAKVKGHLQVFGTPTVAPYWLMPFDTISTNSWIYPGLAKVYRVHTSGTTTTHTDLTRTSGGDYSATASSGWNGGVLGGIAILNNGVDEPQFMGTASGAKLANLTNWLSSTTCAVMRPFRNFLVALDTTESATRYPFRVRWSHPAEGGTVPTSWNAADATKDAGYVDLSQSAGFVIDCLPLGDVNIVYKEDSIWSMAFEGGQSIFGFRQLFSDAGILGRHCVKDFDNKHFVVSVDDVYIHDGQTKQSIVDSQIRDELFNSMHPDYKTRTFVSVDREKNEMWVNFVSNTNNTNAFADMAFVYNFRNNSWSKRDLPYVSFIDWGVVEYVSTTDWTESGDWDTDSDAWDSPLKPSLLLASPSATKVYVLGSNQNAGVSYRAWVEKDNMQLGYPGTKSIKKLVPRISGTGSVDFYVGSEMSPHEGTTWKGPYTFTSGVHSEIPVRVTGNYLGIRAESTDDNTWALANLEVHWTPQGNRGAGV